MDRYLDQRNDALTVYEHLKDLAITISPKQSNNSPEYDFHNNYWPLIAILRKSCDRFCLYPEVQHPTGRLHYHGILLVKDKYNFYHHTIPKLKTNYGYVDIKHIKTPIDKIKWTIYCMKEWAFTRKLVKSKKPIYKQRRLTISKPHQKIIKNNLSNYGFFI